MTVCTRLFSIALLISNTAVHLNVHQQETGSFMVQQYNGILSSLGKKEQGSSICTNIKPFPNYFMHKKQNTQLYMLVLVFF